MEERDNEMSLTGVVSAAVGPEREADIKESAAALERSVSWVVNKIMELGWERYFKKYPLSKPVSRRAA
jgi:hypothetical protein